MKVCIVTLYRTINSGSYLQTFALKNFFDSMGHEAYVLEYKYTLKSRIKDILKYPKNFIFENYMNYKTFVDTNVKFKKMQKQLNLITYKKAIETIELFVFGSDTIWNIDSENLYKLRNILFGISFKNKRKISYAASFANTSYEKIKSCNDIVMALNNYDSISVRDEESYNIIKKICNSKPNLVCDPTLLVDKNIYYSLMNDVKPEKYIFVYAFSDLDFEMQKNLIKFAHDKNLKIISGTKSFKWCDMRVSNSPDSFLTYISNADYVITDTFHGTIFSTIFNRQFIVINRNKKKVNDYIKRIELENILISDNKHVGLILSQKINYKKVNKLIEKYRNESCEYIKDSLK